MPDIETERMATYPEPVETGWENKYRYAYAKDEVYSSFLKRIQTWAKEADDIEKQKLEIPKIIV